MTKNLTKIITFEFKLTNFRDYHLVVSQTASSALSPLSLGEDGWLFWRCYVAHLKMEHTVQIAHCTVLTFAVQSLSPNCVVLHCIKHPCTSSSSTIINIRRMNETKCIALEVQAAKTALPSQYL